VGGIVQCRRLGDFQSQKKKKRALRTMRTVYIGDVGAGSGSHQHVYGKEGLLGSDCARKSRKDQALYPRRYIRMRLRRRATAGFDPPSLYAADGCVSLSPSSDASQRKDRLTAPMMQQFPHSIARRCPSKHGWSHALRNMFLGPRRNRRGLCSIRWRRAAHSLKQRPPYGLTLALP